MMKRLLKNTVKKCIVSSTILSRGLIRLTADVPRVFVYHRFAPSGPSIHRVSRDMFARQLQEIKSSFQVLSLAQLLDYFYTHGAWPKQTAVITVDDGYLDFYEQAYPELKALNLPATFFITALFVDKQIWLWPDRIEYALKHTTLPEATLQLGSTNHSVSLRSDQQRLYAWEMICDYCIAAMDDDKWDVIRSLESQLKVMLPKQPPIDYAAVTWDQLREMSRNNIEIGSHTLSHPILSRIDKKSLIAEICDSKEQIETALNLQVFTFCYPNSAPGDINDQVIAQVKASGYTGAVFGIDLKRWEPYQVPRIPGCNDMVIFRTKMLGTEIISQKFKNNGPKGYSC